MKNKITIIVCIMLVACIAVFAVACQPKDADGLIKLSTPKNLELNGSVLSWDEVENAKEYFISINGVEREQSVTNTTCDLSLIVTGFGDFSITVRAYGDGEKYGTSDKSKAKVYHKGKTLDTPIVVINANDKVATWQPIERAANYSVKVVDGKNNTLDELTVTEKVGDVYSYSFDKKSSSEDDKEENDIYGKHGEYIISVIANPSSEDKEYSPSSAGVKSYYNSMQLETPKFRSMSGTTISWNSVSTGDDYKVTYNLIMVDEEGNIVGDSGELSSTSYSYRSKFNFDEVGKYIFKVRATGNNTVYISSDYSTDDGYVINKLAPIDAEKVKMTYGADGVAKLSWEIDAASEAKEFTLNLSMLLPNGNEELTNAGLKKIISNDLKFAEEMIYDFYKYGAGGENGIVKEEGTEIRVYRGAEGNVVIRYNSVEYTLKDSKDNEVLWKDYTHKSNRVDIIFNTEKSEFIYDEKENHDQQGELVNQDTEQRESITDGGKPKFYWDNVDGESDIKVIRNVVYGSDGKISKHTFEVTLDDVFIKDTTDGSTSEGKYTIDDDRYYGKLFNVSISANRNDGNKYIASQSVTVAGQYMSYKIPQFKDGKYIVTNSGEYAYMILRSFIEPNNTDEYSIEDNINFNGYEIAQINTFKGVINGNKHTVSGIVIGSKILTANGVVNNDKENMQYSMFVNIANGAEINNVFYVGMSFVGYDVEEFNKEGDVNKVTSIQVAPIAINNNGTISDVLVQIDSLKAQSAEVAGMVINNDSIIKSASVYATIEGRIVGGVMINNNSGAQVSDVGFYGKVTSTVGKLLSEQKVTSVKGAGFVVNNEGNINNSFAIGSIDEKNMNYVTVTATQVEGIYAGGFVAINSASGSITNSYSGEFTLNNITATVTANGNNAYAGGFVAYNEGSIESCYSTNEGAAEVVGGFVGFNGNGASIKSCYSTGGANGADGNNKNKGAFVGQNQGSGIADCVSYSRNGKGQTVDGLTSTSKLEDIVSALYGENQAQMGMTDENSSNRYRNPIISGIIYSKDNTSSVRPLQTGDDLDILTRVALLGDDEGEIKVFVHGDNGEGSKGNRIVIELRSTSESVASRYIYGTVR